MSIMLNVSKILLPVFLILFSFVSCEKEEKIANDIYYRWEMVDFMSVESVAYPKNNSYNPIIQFHKNGNYTLELDVNSCIGSFDISSGNGIELSATGCTYVCCDSNYSEKIASTLPKVKSYELDKNKLKLIVPGWGWINLELHN